MKRSNILTAVCLISLACSVREAPAAPKQKVATNAYRAKAMLFLAGNADNQSRSERGFSVTLVDLNGDGVPEAFALDQNPDSCGSHGCSATVLDLTGAKARSLGDFIAFGVEALPTRTGGWRDISINGHKQIFRAGKYEVAR